VKGVLFGLQAASDVPHGSWRSGAWRSMV
jgi:hypothetical protein